MCCLFGLLDVKHRLSPSEKSRILSILGVYCEVRGVDATGFCYNHKGKLVIVKKPIPAHDMAFRISSDAHVIMGHTRMTTQGSAAKQENNHPFLGQLPNIQFALAHNGVLSNDTALRKSEKLPKTAIETDSYVAVQLLEKQKSLDFQSLRKMAEKVKGTFTFTILDRKNQLYIIKGNNPLCLYYFEEGFYLYASTKAILDSALETMGYLDLPHKEIDIADGEILKIAPNGHRSSCFFQPPPSICCYAPIYDDIWNSWYPVESDEPEGYRRFLMDFGVTLGIPEHELQFLHLSGYPDMDLEECIYNPNYRRLCLMEAGYYDEMEEEHEYLAAVPW